LLLLLLLRFFYQAFLSALRSRQRVIEYSTAVFLCFFVLRSVKSPGGIRGVTPEEGEEEEEEEEGYSGKDLQKGKV